MLTNKNFPSYFLLLFLLLFPNVSDAYLGLGALIPFIGNALVLVFIVIITVLAFFSYPIKKIYDNFFFKKKKK